MLVEALEYMHLAISQAAAYIQQQALRTSIDKYLEEVPKKGATEGQAFELGQGKPKARPQRIELSDSHLADLVQYLYAIRADIIR